MVWALLLRRCASLQVPLWCWYLRGRGPHSPRLPARRVRRGRLPPTRGCLGARRAGAWFPLPLPPGTTACAGSWARGQLGQGARGKPNNSTGACRRKAGRKGCRGGGCRRGGRAGGSGAEDGWARHLGMVLSDHGQHRSACCTQVPERPAARSTGMRRGGFHAAAGPRGPWGRGVGEKRRRAHAWPTQHPHPILRVRPQPPSAPEV